MIKWISLAVFIVFTACSSSSFYYKTIPATSIPRPCDDSTLTALRAIPIDEMSERQFLVYQRKEHACENWNASVTAAQMQANAVEAAAYELDIISTTMLFTIAVGVGYALSTLAGTSD